IVRHDPPIEKHERRLFVVRDDGAIFGDGAPKPMAALPVEVTLPEIPAAGKLLSASAVKAYAGGYRPDPAPTFNAVVDIVDRFIDFNKSLAEQRTMAE